MAVRMGVVVFAWIVSAAMAASPSCVIAGEPAVDFLRDVQPILAERCWHCHGVDEGTREGGLRLDQREAALLGGDSELPAIVPGKPQESELLRRVVSTDASEVMPPPSEKHPLSETERKVLEDWIAQGAEYAEHWAFVPPVKVALPEGATAQPVDVLIQSELQRRGLPSTSLADGATLCRRLYLDLIGLPPSPEELEAFEREGYEATVDKLLKSERYGEKWARGWLDAARYSDTNGYEKDLPRDQWIWRDWVIRAFNEDLPYDQFIIEQIAGDLLPGATQDQIIATGFLRNSMLNEEGAIVPEQFRMVEMFDRVDCIGKAVLGLTTQCAQCHSHKFDPFTLDDYYGMFAFINNTYEARSWVYNEAQEAEIAKIHDEISAAQQQIRESRPNWEAELAAWEQSLRESQPIWTYPAMFQLESISGLNHPVQLEDRSILMLGHTSGDVFYVTNEVRSGLTGIRLEVLAHQDLPFGGPGRNAVGGWNLQAFEVQLRRPGGNWEAVALSDATADFSEPEVKHGDGKRITGPASLAIDGTDETLWTADRGVGRRNRSSVAAFRFAQPLDAPEGSELKVIMRMQDMIGCARIGLTDGSQPSVPPIDHDVMLAIEKSPEQRTATERDRIFDAWSRTVPELQPMVAQIDAAWARYPQGFTSVLHLAERDQDHQRKTFKLDRGEWNKPTEVVESPEVPSAFHPMPESDEPTRLRFARWLVDTRSPLAARVEVNRIWQAIWGVGLVETADDFGTRAPAPIHRDLLDWLAVDMMEQGWSRKHIVRTIVMSEAYRRSSKATPALLEADPNNRLLTRGPRFRADAEVIRDLALSVSGLITHRMGGPGVIPPVPQNVLDYNYVYPSYWTAATGPERYRRTVYGFRKRSMPDPSTSVFDAPNGDLSCVRRVRSNTPLAALTGLNEPIFVESARALALRVLREAGADEESRINHAFLLCVSRMPNANERAALDELLQSTRQRLADGWLDPREITTGELGKLPELPEGVTPQDAAAWTVAARVLLNLDETLTKN